MLGRSLTLKIEVCEKASWDIFKALVWSLERDEQAQERLGRKYIQYGFTHDGAERGIVCKGGRLL
jgi:hypothetical protein